jgi:hypothetical protein
LFAGTIASLGIVATDLQLLLSLSVASGVVSVQQTIP